MIRLSARLITAATLTFGSLVVMAPTAQAQATRTWISGVGDDANPCSRTAPCKTLQGSISKTAAGGEINCLDPGGWGAVTITKSITIDCGTFPGGTLNAGTNGIVINAASTDAVVIRGLEITGAGGASRGLNGVRFLAGGSLTLENVVIRNQSQWGVSFAPTTAARLNMINVTVLNSGTAATTSGGILLQPGAGGSVFATLQGVRSVGHFGFGLSVVPGNGPVLASVNDSIFNNNTDSGISITTTNTAQSGRLFVNNTQVSYNTIKGINLDGGNLVAGFANTLITGNGTGIVTANTTAALGVRTYSNNRLNGNSTEGAFTGPIPQQ